MPIDGKPIKGRGAATQVANRFLKHSYGIVHWEGIDEVEEEDRRTRYVVENAKTIVNKVNSPDLRMNWSMNPYQGCEHGCAYCYARPTHEYWGYSAGLDFERVIIMKRNAPEVLRKTFMDRKWVPEPIMFSGNTDCYQPVERKERITRSMLEVCLEFRQPVAMITKNALILRDLDLLSEMASRGLASVAISLTTLNEDLRRVMEPRTSTGANRVRTIETLTKAGVPTMVMIAPIIPALNEHEIPALLQAAADAGALGAGYTIVRTNGAVKPVFDNWVHEHFPDRAAKVIAQVSEMHGGAMNDSQFGRRMKGEGEFARSVHQLFRINHDRAFRGRTMPVMNTQLFQRPPEGQLELFP
ncbi:MAG: PA0069 family radical SAM protein [Flavobacteriales bacterium]|nr:PA0069 family radical SAM protein [Flavobacteriales bacterium]